MDDALLDRLLAGDLGRLPSLPKRVVRLFISSTFTDMTLERNSLMERVYPRLKKYCRERHGLDFQVVDMRWGVRDEATDDHQTVNLCSREIDNCQRVSLGPNFVALIGDKYGFRPLLNRIKSTEYRSLRRCLIESDINTDFLDTWYKEDLNAVPAEYVLQPISSILKNFTNKAEPELQMVDQKIWQAIQERLHDLLLIGSERLVRQGRMSERERALKYSISVTEREVLEGCLELNATKSQCLVYVRSIVDLRDQLAKYFDDLSQLATCDDNNNTLTGKQQSRQLVAPGSPNGSNSGDSVTSGGGASSRRDSASRKASLKIGDDTISLTTSGAQTSAERKLERRRRLIGKFIDLTAKDGRAWQIDEDAQEALSELKQVKLREKLGPARRNLTVYEVHWNDQDGISAKSEEHKQYLNDFTEHFYQNLTRMIRSAVKSERKVKTSGLVGEIMQHSHYSLQVAARVHGRSSELEQLRVYIQTGTCQAPLTGGASGGGGGGGARRQTVVLPMFLYGVGGSGKTSVLARVATLAGEWIKQAALYRRRSSASLSTREELGLPDRWDRNPCIITRFCCTTPASSSIVGVLTSVCRQLQYNFYQYGPLNGLLDKQQLAKNAQWNKTSNKHDQLVYQRIPEDFVRLVHTFRQLLNNCRHPLHKRRVFVVIIDSVERLLAPAECSLEAKYSWLTSLTRLPANVRLIVSCGSSSVNPNNSLSNAPDDDKDDDYLHLKRHFLQAHYKLHEANLTSGQTESESPDSESDHHLSSASESSEVSSAGIVGPLQSRSPTARSSTSRYQLIKRLILPATRLARGSKSFTFEEGQSIAREASGARPSPVVVRFGPSTMDGKRGSGEENAYLSRKRVVEFELSRKESMASSNSSQSEDSSHAETSKHRPTRSSHLAAFTGAGLLHIRPLGAHLGQAVLRHWLAEAGRNLSQQQWSIVNKSLAGCSRPIFVKLAFGEVINWKSYSMQGDTKGLTFGSAWLGDFALEKLSICPELEQLCNAISWDGDDQERARLKWQMLSMEQQWLNYLDYQSRKAEPASQAVGQPLGARASTTTTTGGGELVIRVGGDSTGPQGSKSQRGSTLLLTAGTTTTTSGRGAAGGPSSSLSICCHLSDTIEDAICQLFARIELQHGYLLTKHSLSYITAARNGICENELEDILSLDDVVLDDVFQYHLPPVRRIPPLLWTRIRNDLPDYLSERDADGIVVAWHHNQFKSVTERRYLADDSQLVYIHSLLADYFIGKWADKPKPFRCTRQQVQMAAEQLESAVQKSMRRDSDQAAGGGGKRGSRSSLTGRLGSGSAAGGGGGPGRAGTSFSVRNRLRSSDQHDQRLQWMQAKALRRVPHQPIFYESSQTPANASVDGSGQPGEGATSPPGVGGGGGASNRDESRKDRGSEQRPALCDPVKRRYNLRKLTELPYHLMRSGRFIDLARLVLFNYRWLFASIDALGLQSLFCDLDEACQYLELELAKRRSSATGGGSGEQQQWPKNDEEDGDGDKLADLPVGPARQQEVRPATSGVGGALDPATLELAIAERDNLTSAALESLIQQVTMLGDTLRLSSSVIHSQPQMLAAQLIGRLFPAVEKAMLQIQQEHGPHDKQLNGESSPASYDSNHFRRSKLDHNSTVNSAASNFLFLDKLLEQCHREGASDCGLLPMGHGLCTADGLKLSSLEGHPFGVTAMALASDKRHLLAVSSKFIMWNISTGEIAREIEPKLSGAVMRGLVMCASNQFALAYSSDNTILALEILTQQVVKLDLRREMTIFTGKEGEEEEASDQIIGLELIDQREARRFFVWTRAGRLVVMRLEDDPQHGDGQITSQANELSESEFFISIEYQIGQVTMKSSCNSSQVEGPGSGRLLEVAVSELESQKHDLVLLTIADENEHERTRIRFGTLKVSFNYREDSHFRPEKVEVWPGDPPHLAHLRQVNSLALSRPSMSQLVVADSQGNICLRRRRATRWSEPKILACASSFGREDSAPFAIELESSQMDGTAVASAKFNPIIDRELEKSRLAEFEAKIDGDCDEIRGVSRSVFRKRSSDSLDFDNSFRTEKKKKKNRKTSQSDQVQFVKLYLSSCIVVIRLNSQVGSHQSYQRKCLMLPRDIRNVCLEPNKSQLVSKIIPLQPPVGGGGGGDHQLSMASQHYLAVAANRKLLIYSIESEQLLKCYDAHSKRITSLLAICRTATTQVGLESIRLERLDREANREVNSSSSSSMQQFSLALATCSLDRTVNIWNLQNINKEERQIDSLSQPSNSHSSASSSPQFESIQVNSQLPLAACMSQGQLTIWEWPASRLVLTFNSQEDLLAANEQLETSGQVTETRQRTPLTRCKFSSNGRYLALATTLPSIHLLACEGPQMADGSPGGRRAAGPSAPIRVKQLARTTRLGGPVRSMDFFARDSRLVVVTECQADQEHQTDLDGSSTSTQSDLNLDELASTTIGTISEDDEEEHEDETSYELELFERITISCLAVPEMRSVYSFGSLVPKCRSRNVQATSSSSSQQHTSQYIRKHVKGSRENKGLTFKQQVPPPTMASTNQKNRMVSLTSDQQILVVVEAKSADQGQIPFERRKSLAARRRSSAFARPQLALNLYASRDGKFVATIDLGQLQTFAPQQQPVGPHPPPPPVRVNQLGERTHLNGFRIPAHQKLTSNSPLLGSGGASQSQYTTIKSNQFNRLKAIRNRERQSLVALIDDQQGTSFIIDINSKILITCSSSWIGKLTSDGRYGLSRMFAATGSVGGGRAVTMGMSHRAHAYQDSPAGLKLLEMRHCQPLKSLLTLDQLNGLNGKSTDLDRTSGHHLHHSDTICGFTKPNDAYVYFCDLRQRRLILIRTRDSHLIANYKLSTPISHLKCSGDGYALILAQADGSLIPLAIVDPQSSDAQNRLQSHLARRHLSGAMHQTVTR